MTRLFPPGSRAAWAASAVLMALALLLPPICGAVELAFPDTFSASYTLILGVGALVLALWALSYNLMFGYAGMVSFAHAAYYGVGAYTVALLFTRYQVPALLGLALAPLVAGLIGFLTGAVALRAVRLYFSLLTLAISQLFYVIAFESYSITGGDNGLHGIEVPDFLFDPTNQYYFIAAVVGVAAVLLFVLGRSPFGAALQLVRENRTRAAFVGLNVKRYELAVFTISSAFAGLAGGLYAIYDQQANPQLMFWTASAQPVVVTLLGGAGAFLGPAAGAAVFTVLANTIGRQFPFHFDIVLGAVVLGVVLLVPGGLASVLDLARRDRAKPPADEELVNFSAPEVHGLRPEATPLADEKLLVIDGLSRRFGGLQAVDGVSLDVRRGERHAVIGPNGAGKSTLFNLLTGHIRPDSGRVILGGRDITGKPPFVVARSGVARAFQLTSVFPRLSVLENVSYAMLAQRRLTTRPFGRARQAFREESMETLRSVGLDRLAGVAAGLLSHGDQRALELAIALALQSELLLLDEPTAGMSPYETRRAMELVRATVAERGLTLLFCEHDMEVVFGTAQRVTVMHQGRVLAAGTPEEVRADPQVQTVYLGSEDEAAFSA